MDPALKNTLREKGAGAGVVVPVTGIMVYKMVYIEK